jgi:DNA (cytosine-5)-methyltransferase 1
MAAYYNEIDPYAAQWLRNLIAAFCGQLWDLI